MVKTKDLEVNYIDFTIVGREFDAKRKTALKIEGRDGNDTIIGRCGMNTFYCGYCTAFTPEEFNMV